jgi:hypothetical protein
MVCGVLFAVHPVHSEAVASFAYRKDILAMVFVQLALLLWFVRHRPVLSHIGAPICLSLGLVSKEVAAIGAIPMMFLTDLLPRARDYAGVASRLRRSFPRFAPLVVLGIMVTFLTAGDRRGSFMRESIRGTFSYLDSYDQVLCSVAAAIPDVFRLLFVPIRLSFDRPPLLEPSMGNASVQAGLILAIGWLVANPLVWRLSAVAAFAMCWTAHTYLPSSNIISLSRFFIAERYLYVPSFGVRLLLAVFLERARGAATRNNRAWPRIAVLVLSIVLPVAGGVRTFMAIEIGETIALFVKRLSATASKLHGSTRCWPTRSAERETRMPPCFIFRRQQNWE